MKRIVYIIPLFIFLFGFIVVGSSGVEERVAPNFSEKIQYGIGGGPEDKYVNRSNYLQYSFKSNISEDSAFLHTIRQLDLNLKSTIHAFAR